METGMKDEKLSTCLEIRIGNIVQYNEDKYEIYKDLGFFRLIKPICHIKLMLSFLLIRTNIYYNNIGTEQEEISFQ